MKTFKPLSISFLLWIILSSCSLSGMSGTPTQTTDQILAVSAAAMTSQSNPAQTQNAIVLPTSTLPLATTSPTTTPTPPNTPVWLVYKYTCEFVVNGGNMTMNLTWTDRSNTEDGYKVYRDKQVIATLAPNSTSYLDVAFVATGRTLSYSVEAFNLDWRASSSTITYGCQ